MTQPLDHVEFPEHNIQGCKMWIVVLGAFVVGWMIVVQAYGKKGIKGFRPHLLGFCGGIVALVLAGAVVTRFEPNERVAAGTAPAATPASQAGGKELVSTSAREMFAEYEANEVAADRAFKGKEIDIVGTVQSIDKDAFDNIVVQLQTSNQFMPVSAVLQDRYESEAASMRKADIVGFICVGAGRSVGRPVLKDCRPAQLESSGAKK